MLPLVRPYSYRVLVNQSSLLEGLGSGLGLGLGSWLGLGDALLFSPGLTNVLDIFVFVGSVASCGYGCLISCYTLRERNPTCVNELSLYAYCFCWQQWQHLVKYNLVLALSLDPQPGERDHCQHPSLCQGLHALQQLYRSVPMQSMWKQLTQLVFDTACDSRKMVKCSTETNYSSKLRSLQTTMLDCCFGLSCSYFQEVYIILLLTNRNSVILPAVSLPYSNLS